jgi:hypothetical protein
MSNKWEIPLDTILESMTKSGSKKRLVRRFGVDTNREMHQITSDEAKVLGLVSRGIYLEDFEFPEYFRYWDLERKQVSSIISKLWKRGVVRINFEVDDYRLVSLASIVQGTSNRVCSFLESLLTHAPTSLVWVNEQYDKGVVISRFPDHMVYDLAAKLNQYGIQEDLVIRCMRPRSYRSFNFRLYERLLRPDGTWDDDVSAFLSQARSKRRELSKSNA